MTTQMVHGKVDLYDIAQKVKVPAQTVEKIVNQIVMDTKARRRQPKASPPEGGISIRAAARKYGLQSATLSDWRRDGIIATILETKNEIYVSEESVAKVAEEYKQNPGRGKHTIKRDN